MFSDRVKNIKPSGVREIFEMASKDAINLGLGELDFDPPVEAKDALREALDQGMSRYGQTKGVPELRQMIAEYVSQYNKSITAENVIITASGTEGTIATFQSMFNPGDEILIPDPGFVLYHPNCILAGAIPIAYGLEDSHGFQPDVEEMKELITPKTKAIVVNSPSNPTGSVLTREVFQAIIDLARDYDLWVISDEVYENFIYEGKHYSFLEALERAVVLNSFSKSLAIPGWRIGYLVSTKEMIEEISKMQYHLVACAPTPAQYAVQKVFPDRMRFIDELLPVFDRRRRLMTNLLNNIEGFECHMPQGAFYTFPRFSMNISSKELARSIVSAGVICSPGIAFGDRGERHMRFSYAASEENIRNGMEIIKRVVDEIV